MWTWRNGRRWRRLGSERRSVVAARQGAPVLGRMYEMVSSGPVLMPTAWGLGSCGTPVAPTRRRAPSPNARDRLSLPGDPPCCGASSIPPSRCPQAGHLSLQSHGRPRREKRFRVVAREARAGQPGEVERWGLAVRAVRGRWRRGSSGPWRWLVHSRHGRCPTSHSVVCAGTISLNEGVDFPLCYRGP